jgi:hypothetical protein
MNLEAIPSVFWKGLCKIDVWKDSSVKQSESGEFFLKDFKLRIQYLLTKDIQIISYWMGCGSLYFLRKWYISFNLANLCMKLFLIFPSNYFNVYRVYCDILCFITDTVGFDLLSFLER